MGSSKDLRIGKNKRKTRKLAGATPPPAKCSRDFSLEVAELEMVLAWKKDEKLKFDTAVRSALGSTGNDFLFTFPAERFPIDTTHVAAIRLCGDDDTCVAYVYREPENGDMLVAHGDALDTEYLDFATSFANILSALGPSITAIRQQQELH